MYAAASGVAPHPSSSFRSSLRAGLLGTQARRSRARPYRHASGAYASVSGHGLRGPGNGDYRGELLRAIGVITNYATKLGLPTVSVLLRLDGLYGDAAPLLDVLTAGLGVIARSRDY